MDAILLATSPIVKHYVKDDDGKLSIAAELLAIAQHSLNDESAQLLRNTLECTLKPFKVQISLVEKALLIINGSIRNL